MEMQTSPTHTPTAQKVGNAFVEQYYNILHQHPSMVYKFYSDSSVLSRPSPDGDMLSVNTMKDINDVIMSQDYKEYKAEIRTIDAQDSYEEGVVVLVTGWLTMKHNVKRAFTQSFFLASEDNGKYFVLNDVFRYVDEYNTLEPTDVSVEDITENIPSAPVTPDPEPSHIPDHPVADIAASALEAAYGNGRMAHEVSDNVEAATPAVAVPYGNGEIVHEISNDVEVSVMKAPVVEAPDHSGQSKVPPVAEPTETVQKGTLKTTYASIVKAKPTSPVCVSITTTFKVAPGTAIQHSASTPSPQASAPSSNIAASNGRKSEEVEGHSIYIWGLPFNTKVLQVEEEFKKFGAITPYGVQVKNKNGFCFGFVEYVSLDSMQSALEASTITIGDRTAHIEKKKTTTRVGPPNGNRPNTATRNGFRDDNYRGQGNFGGGGRGYGRNDSGNHGGFSSRQGPSGRGGDGGYQQVGDEKGRQAGTDGMKQIDVSA